MSESPDILNAGRWVLDRGVQRWVADPHAAPQCRTSELDLPRCAECERKQAGQLKRGLCPACYARYLYWRKRAA